MDRSRERDGLPAGNDVHSGRVVTSRNDTMRSEQARLRTFVSWPKADVVTPEELARCGFYYIGPEDRVKCHFCKAILRNWEPGDVPMEEHRTKCPECPFAMGLVTDNIDMRDNRSASHDEARGLDSVPDSLAALGQNSGTSSIREEAASVPPLSSQGSVAAPTEPEELPPEEAPDPSVEVTPAADPMQSEEARLMTFIGRTWTNTAISPDELAQSGLYWIQDNRVQCYLCNVILHTSNWRADDVPMEKHRRESPGCPFAAGVVMDNVPLCDSRPLSIPSALLAHQHNHDHPMAIEFNRLSTFTDWPSHCFQQPAAMAAAGFYRDGRGDRVCCFYCGGVLHDWHCDDDPWVVHDRYFPGCGYVRQTRGFNFVSRIHQSLYEDGRLRGTTRNVAFVGVSLSKMEAADYSKKKQGSRGNADLVRSPPRADADLTQGEQTASEGAKSPTVAIQEGAIEICLAKENLQLKEERRCVICHIRDRNTVLLPCGHLVACVPCGTSCSACPVCRQRVSTTIRVFQS